MSPYCQIEHLRSDSDVGMPCSNRAVTECSSAPSAGLRFAAIVERGVAGSRSVKFAGMTT